MTTSERWGVVGAEDDPATEGHIQYLPLVTDGEDRDSWAFAGVSLPPRVSYGQALAGREVYLTALLAGEQAIVVTCRAEDRAALLEWLCARLNAWEGQVGDDQQ